MNNENLILQRIAIVFFLLFIAMTGGPGFSQIVIDQADMPGPGDTLRVSITTTVPEGYSNTGMDMAWDFSALETMTQRLDTFISATSTPSAYQLFFVILGGANLASPLNTNFIPGIPISQAFTFYKNDQGSYSDLGSAYTVQELPLPIKYDIPDKYYEFPMHPGMTWSSTSAFSIAIPDLAYYLTRRTRTSQVDGWGSLITPYGTFQTLRIKSLLSLHDSVYIDSLGTGFPLNRNITEYKWLAKGYGVPILQINEEAGIAVATYRDFLRKPQGIAGTSVETLNLYPNPTNGIISLNIPALDHPVVMKISSSLGGLLKEFPIDNPDQKNIFDFSDLSDGLYFLQIADEGKIWVGKILILHY